MQLDSQPLRRHPWAAATAAAVLLLAVAACAPAAPTGRVISPADGRSYTEPRISADGETVVYTDAPPDASPTSPRNVHVTRMASGATTVVPDVGAILAMNSQATRVLSLEIPVSPTGPRAVVVDLRSGARYPLPGFPSALQLEDDLAVGVPAVPTAGTGCPCERHLVVWRDGAQIADFPLTTSADLERTWLFDLSTDGGTAFLFDGVEQQLFSVDTTTGARTDIAVQLPGAVETGRFFHAADDAGSFLWSSRWATFRVSPSAPEPVSHDPYGRTISPDGHFGARYRSAPTAPPAASGRSEEFWIADLTGSSRSTRTVATVVGPADRPNRLLGGTVADTGRSAYSLAPVLESGELGPYAVHVDS